MDTQTLLNNGLGVFVTVIATFGIYRIVSWVGVNGSELMTAFVSEFGKLNNNWQELNVAIKSLTTMVGEIPNTAYIEGVSLKMKESSEERHTRTRTEIISHIDHIDLSIKDLIEEVKKNPNF